MSILYRYYVETRFHLKGVIGPLLEKKAGNRENLNLKVWGETEIGFYLPEKWAGVQWPERNLIYRKEVRDGKV
jgi:hypothetical protein